MKRKTIKAKRREEVKVLRKRECQISGKNLIRGTFKVNVHEGETGTKEKGKREGGESIEKIVMPVRKQ